MLDALDFVVAADPKLRVRQRFLEAAEENVEDERAFPRARNARHRGHAAQGDGDVDVLEVVLPGFADRPAGLWPAAARPEPGPTASPRRYFAVRESGERRISASGPSATTRPPCSPAPGAEVEDEIGGPDGLLVVLDDQDGVAVVPDPPEQADQPAVVALVESDRRLVEDIEDAAQARPDLGRQADPLGFAARKGRRRPV